MPYPYIENDAAYNINAPVKFPEKRRELLYLLSADQKELKKLSLSIRNTKPESKKILEIKEVAIKCQQRSDRVLEIIDEIVEPSIGNVGREGSEAIVILTMHSYVEAMKKVLYIYQAIFKDRPNDIAGYMIPMLIDRVMVLEKRRQSFGTDWFPLNNHWYLIPIINFRGVNKRRKHYGLSPLVRPNDNEAHNPKLATANDQKDIPENEFRLNYAFMDTRLT